MSCSRTQHGGGRSRTPDLSLRSPTRGGQGDGDTGIRGRESGGGGGGKGVINGSVYRIERV